ncbi:IclR family transcriptional regulator C-terminal domain-containing protein [Georgenia yuyongxinii]|uniref:IclR family transcriptional regulator domain-containing protein n=1 Tax=Georgenia yuyongxinii TaxID=2589797 RepID=UPI001E37805E|nr:IclR family transcriptional regulator C-terminal domain-containing protein [Georgenia yuyongxinii]
MSTLDDAARDGGALRDAADDAERATEIVRSLERGLAIIRVFDAEHPRLTLSMAAALSGMPRAGARRALNTLVELGYAGQDGRDFYLRPRLLELGFELLADLTLADVITPHLQALSGRLGESASASVLDGGQIVYIARVATRSIMRVHIRTGTRFPAESTSMGRVLLASRSAEWLEGFISSVRVERRSAYTTTDTGQLRAVLAGVREQGFALVDQELEEGLRSLAVPVHGREGRVVAAINVATAVVPGRADDMVARVLPELRRAAEAIDADLRPFAHMDT